MKAGHPVEEIVKEDKKLKAGFIVIGSHGKSSVQLFSAELLSTLFSGIQKSRSHCEKMICLYGEMSIAKLR